ncbi:hypothetical protein [Burkholderia gladioli]|uniref:hypothetical protein n=1 Tax=Burkholderia gladioli TaxID=28095 RepID=UPI0034DB4EBF
MTNNTTALTVDEREKLIDLVDRLIRNPDAVTAKDCIIGNDVRTVQWIAEHTRALLTSPRAADSPRGTDAQILFERKLTCEAIDGAIAFGHQGTNQPPDADHWLAPFWIIGRRLALLDAAPAAPVAELVMHPLTDAALCEALDEFELVCENNDVRRLTDDEKYAAQEFALSLIHGDPSGAQAVAADGAPSMFQRAIDVGGKVIPAYGERGDMIALYADQLALVADGQRAAVSPATADERAAFAYHDDPANTGVGTYCNPGDRREPRWLLQFEDADRGVSIYESESDARKAFAHAEGRGYNCYLFSPTLRASQAAAPARIEALRKGLFEARDAMHVISGWSALDAAKVGCVKSWIEDANRVLNGEQAAAPAEAREITMTVEDAMRIVMANWGDKDAIECVFRANVAPTTARTLSKVPADAGEAVALRAEVDRLNAIINTPQSGDFLRAVSIEAEHQRQRWSSEHDAGKTPADWFWLVGYLAGKGLHAHAAGNAEKAEHHVITTAAALANWHLAIFGKSDMRPGTEQPGVQGAQGGKGGEA